MISAIRSWSPLNLGLSLFFCKNSDRRPIYFEFLPGNTPFFFHPLKNLDCTYVCINVCVCMHFGLCVCMYVCMLVRMYLWQYVCMYVCLYVFVSVRTYVRVCLCMYVFMSVRTYVCLYVQILETESSSYVCLFVRLAGDTSKPRSLSRQAEMK